MVRGNQRIEAQKKGLARQAAMNKTGNSTLKLDAKAALAAKQAERAKWHAERAANPKKKTKLQLAKEKEKARAALEAKNGKKKKKKDPNDLSELEAALSGSAKKKKKTKKAKK
eukprot:g4108.t1